MLLHSGSVYAAEADIQCFQIIDVPAEAVEMLFEILQILADSLEILFESLYSSCVHGIPPCPEIKGNTR
jgi:hypothetical protein